MSVHFLEIENTFVCSSPGITMHDLHFLYADALSL